MIEKITEVFSQRPYPAIKYRWMLTGEYSCPDCLPGDSIILTRQGLIELDSFNPGELVTPDGFHHSPGLLEKGNSRLFKTTLDHGYELRASATQKFMTFRQRGFCWTVTYKLKPGDWMVFQSNSLKNLPSRPELRSIGELLGYISGNGSFNRETRHLSISFGKQAEETAQYVYSLWQEHFGNNVKLKDRKQQFEISARSDKYFQYLARFGMIESKYDLPVAPSKEFYYGYLRGLFSADGNIGDGSQITLASANKKFLLQTQNILLACGIVSSVYLTIERTSTEINHIKCNAKNLYCLKILGGDNAKKFKNLINFIQIEKRNKFSDEFGSQGNQGIYYPLKPFPTYLKRSNRVELTKFEMNAYRSEMKKSISWIDEIEKQEYVFLKIQKIEREKFNTKIYDVLDVEKTQSFLANNAVVHNCTWLAKNSDFRLEDLPTYPAEGPTYCGEHCDCYLEVVLPDFTHFEIIPELDSRLFKSKWLAEQKEKEWATEYGGDVPSFISILGEQFRYHWELIKALFIDFGNMEKVDKFFSVFFFQPSIKDLMVAKRQASKEIWAAQPPITAAQVAKMTPQEVDKMLDLDKKIRARTIELLRTGQVLEIEKQLGFWENFMLEMITSEITAGTARVFFAVLKKGILGVKNWTEVPAVARVLRQALKEAEHYRSAALEKEIVRATQHAKTLTDHIYAWSLELGKNLVDEIDYFISFWKDCVLIFHTGTAVRNIADNTLKTVNEMLNGLVKREPFWAFMIGKNRRILQIPKAVADESWAKYVGDYEHLKNMEKGGYMNWYLRLRETLYENLLARPEKWARRGLYAGKLTQYEKQLWKMGYVGADFHEMASKMAIDEVNRVFFDYSKKMAFEVPLARIFPFELYNLRNYNYWLKDFMKYPWKLAAIRSVWHWWSKETGTNCEFNLIGKLPTYLIPGVYFDPLSWVSAYEFIKLFAVYKGDPKWFTAREKHLKWQVEFLKTLPPEVQQKVLTKAKQRSVQEYLDRQRYKTTKEIVGWIDDWFGMLPLWRKILEHYELAEKQEWKKQFPQSVLVEAVTPKILEFLGKDIKPPSTQIRHHLYGIMDAQGIPTEAEIEEEQTRQLEMLTPEQRRARAQQMKVETTAQQRRREKEEREAARKVLRLRIATSIHKTWELKKAVFGFLTGMYLSKSWREIHDLHKAILEEMKADEQPPEEAR